jgi:predicted nucleic acid-binding protein
MRIVLDTSVLWDKPALERLRKEPGDIVLPAVAFTERARQFVRQGRPVAELWRQLAEGGFEVEAFGAEHGLRHAARLDDAAWARLARDALIAGHVGPGDVLWTKNPKDFLAVGLPREQVVGVGPSHETFDAPQL